MSYRKQFADFGLFDRNVPRYTSYPPATQFREFTDSTRVLTWLGELDPSQPISLYVHIPFCRRLCWFCACRTQGLGNDGRLETYLDCLEAEIQLVSSALPAGLQVSRLHFGGGTPTLLAPNQLARLMKAVQSQFVLSSDHEFSIEIDPNEIDDARLDVLTAHGLNRASIGVQDFDPMIQSVIGRSQSHAVTEQAVRMLRARGINSLNADILYGLPHQTEARLTRSIEQLIALEPDRVALYGYAHVPWMAKRQVMIPESALPSPEQRFELSELARVTFENHGYRAIGIDHFAKPTDGLARAQASGHLRRNFQGYTDDTAPTLIGLGASSISKLPQGFVQNDPSTGAYQERIRGARIPVKRGHGFAGEDRLRGRVVEMILCDFCVDFDALSSEGFAVEPWLSVDAATVSEVYAPHVSFDGQRMVIADCARPLARLIAQHFDAYEVASTAHSSAI